MPIYEYQCAACGRVTEKWQKFSEAPLTICPHCGGSLNKLISNCSFHLKGSGWYVTDYAGGGRPNSSTPEKADTAGKSAGSGTGEKSEASAKSESSAASKIK
ncbi:MAG: zinc ribbon domain-containing protein [Deltaproteobacteria bacterium]|nr:zinc ribbon domain-containing protein [Deltaproteobacteria bacterium]